MTCSLKLVSHQTTNQLSPWSKYLKSMVESGFTHPQISQIRCKSLEVAMILSQNHQINLQRTKRTKTTNLIKCIPPKMSQPLPLITRSGTSKRCFVEHLIGALLTYHPPEIRPYDQGLLTIGFPQWGLIKPLLLRNFEYHIYHPPSTYLDVPGRTLGSMVLISPPCKWGILGL